MFQVTRLLAEKNHVYLDPKWALVELVPDLYMERVYEDHEHLVENLLLWKVIIIYFYFYQQLLPLPLGALPNERGKPRKVAPYYMPQLFFITKKSKVKYFFLGGGRLVCPTLQQKAETHRWSSIYINQRVQPFWTSGYRDLKLQIVRRKDIGFNFLLPTEPLVRYTVTAC